MEVTMRKRFTLASWLAAGSVALSAIGLCTHSVNAATYDNAETNLVGTYGVTEGTNTLKVSNNLNPGGIPDEGMSGRSEDLLQFTGTDFTIGAEGETTKFLWKTNFGTRGNADDITVNLVGGTNLFDNQGIYMGSRNEDGGTGGQTTLNILDGTNVFTQRLVVGGEGQTAGKSTVNISGGTNVFSYNKEFDGSESVSDGKHSYTVQGLLGDVKLNKSLGNGRTASTNPNDAKDNEFWTQKEAGNNPEYYGSINMYNYYNNYYGIYFSAMASGHQTEGADLTISGGKNIFNVATYIGGGYDLTPYCSVNTGSDDNDVVRGGINNINFTGGFTNFAARTYFGAQESTTTVNFSGRSTTTFSGTAISEDMDLAMARDLLVVQGSTARYSNAYKGGDLPYVFLGGKNGTTTININGYDNNMTTLNVQTSTFVGGADERWLAGDQYYYDPETGKLVYTFRDGAAGTFHNGIRHDSGVADFNLKSGQLRLGYANTTSIVAERNQDNWNYQLDTNETPYGVVYEPTYYRQRYEQVRMIGAAEGTTFNATGGRIQFDVSIHQDNAEAIANAKNNLINAKTGAVESISSIKEARIAAGEDYSCIYGYDGYFTNMANTVKNAAGEDVLTLEAGMIAFDQINIGKDVDITVGGMGKIMARAETEQGTSLAGATEFYTNTVFADTTQAQYKKTDVLFENDEISMRTETSDVSADLSKSQMVVTDPSASTYANTVYDKWLYKITLEDVNDTVEPGIQTSQVRMHIQTKGKLSDNYIGNIKENGETFTEVLLNGDNPDSEHYCPTVYNAVEELASSSTSAKDASANFDELTGASYGSFVANQIRRVSSFNMMMMDQILASDICMKNIRYGNGCPNAGPDGVPCGQCPACLGTHNWTAWGHFYGDGGKTGVHNFHNGYDTTTYGGMFALDFTNGASCHIGAFFDYSETKQDSHASMGRTHIEGDNYTVGLYAKWLGLFGLGGYGSIISSVSWSDVESNRELYVDDSFSGDTHGVLPTVFYERGWVFFPTETLSLNPFFGLQYAYYGLDEFTEDGRDEVGDVSALRLHVSDIDHHSLRTLVGLRITQELYTNAMCHTGVSLRAKGLWMHDLLGAVDPTLTTYHMENTNFPVWNIKGNNGGRDWAVVGAGADFDLNQRLSFLFDYNVYVNEATTIHAGMGTLRFSF